MDQTAWVTIGSIVTSSGVAIAAVWLAARFAAKQAHIGRIWERKAAAYSAILEALHEMQEWYSVTLYDEFTDRDPDEATQAARQAEYSTARKLLRRSLAREVWLLPTDVRIRVDTMNQVLAARYESWFEDIDTGHAEVKKTIENISELAQTDLKHRPSTQNVEKR